MNFSRTICAATLAIVAAAAAAQGKLPLVDAEVKKLDPVKGTIVLKHQDIPNLGMMGMTMQFDIADRKMLAGVKPGDKVRFTADMVGGRPTVKELHANRAGG
jgi:Cu/Ag efflux protein CusF